MEQEPDQGMARKLGGGAFIGGMVPWVNHPPVVAATGPQPEIPANPVEFDHGARVFRKNPLPPATILH